MWAKTNLQLTTCKKKQLLLEFVFSLSMLGGNEAEKDQIYYKWGWKRTFFPSSVRLRSFGFNLQSQKRVHVNQMTPLESLQGPARLQQITTSQAWLYTQHISRAENNPTVHDRHLFPPHLHCLFRRSIHKDTGFILKLCLLMSVCGTHL